MYYIIILNITWWINVLRFYADFGRKQTLDVTTSQVRPFLSCRVKRILQPMQVYRGTRMGYNIDNRTQEK